MKKTFLLLILIISFLFPANLYSAPPKNREKKIEKERKAKDRKAVKEYKKTLKRHWKGQSKDTYKRMKKHYKNAEKKYGKTRK